MDITYKSNSKNIKFNAHSGGSFEYKESQKTININARMLKVLISFMSKVSAFVAGVYVNIKSKFSS